MNQTPKPELDNASLVSQILTQRSHKSSVQQMLTDLKPSGQGQILDKLHSMRLKAFKNRQGENKTKPHVPFITDEMRAKIDMEYADAKQKMQLNC